jgi:glucose/arabinose dehydrogenase
MIVYSGKMFPAWRGNLLIGALSGEALIRVVVTGDRAQAANQWAMKARIRDVAEAPDGAIWLLQDDGALVRVTPR